MRAHEPKHARPKIQHPTHGRFLGAVIALATLLSLVGLASTASAGAGDGGTVADWTTYNTNDGTESLYPGVWTEDANQVELDPEYLSSVKARLTWANVSGANLGTSIETDTFAGEIVTAHPNDADPDAEQQVVAYFMYDLQDGAVAGGGAPRLFVEVDGTYYNTADHSFPFVDEWGDWDGGGAILLPIGGTIGKVGIVYDNGVEGSVVVSSPIIDSVGIGSVLFFDDVVEEEPGDEKLPPHEGGQSVAEYVKENGGPPPHSKAKANRE